MYYILFMCYYYVITLLLLCYYIEHIKYIKKLLLALSAGFEPTRGNPNGFQVHRLNLSATTTCPCFNHPIKIPRLMMFFTFCSRVIASCPRGQGHIFNSEAESDETSTYLCLSEGAQPTAYCLKWFIVSAVVTMY